MNGPVGAGPLPRRPFFTQEGLAPGDNVVLTFAITQSAGSYTVAAHTPWERTYTCTFRASMLVDISPRDESPTSYPQYQRDHMLADAAPLKEVTRFVPDRVITRW